MTDHAKTGLDDSREPGEGQSVQTVSLQPASPRRPVLHNENKTETNAASAAPGEADNSASHAADLAIEKVWREVVDFGETGCGNGEEGWGRKRVSVARVSILDGPPDGR